MKKNNNRDKHQQ